MQKPINMTPAVSGAMGAIWRLVVILFALGVTALLRYFFSRS